MCIVDFLLLFLIPYIFLIASVGFVLGGFLSNNWIATLRFYETFNIFPAYTVAMKCRLCKKIYLLWVYNSSDSKCNWKKREGGKQKSFLKIIISEYIYAWIISRNDYIWFTYDDILYCVPAYTIIIIKRGKYIAAWNHFTILSETNINLVDTCILN